MILAKMIKRFFQAEDGAVAVDWVVLAGFVVGLGIALTYNLGTAAADHSGAIDRALTIRGIPTY